jgi:hypothetical protein
MGDATRFGPEDKAAVHQPHVCPHPFLVWLYRKIPIAQRILGQQSRIVAAKL